MTKLLTYQRPISYPAIVSDEDYERFHARKWRLSAHNYYYTGAYWKSKDGSETYPSFLHRLVMGLEMYNPLVVDHMNGNRCDNRKENLLVCTQSENSKNHYGSRLYGKLPKSELVTILGRFITFHSEEHHCEKRIVYLCPEFELQKIIDLLRELKFDEFHLLYGKTQRSVIQEDWIYENEI